MVREYLKSVLHEIEEQRKANTAEIEEQTYFDLEYTFMKYERKNK